MAIGEDELYTEIQYLVIEPPDGGQTYPSALWTADEVVNYANQRQNRFLRDTHLQVGIAEIAVTQGTARYDLPDDWIRTVQVQWIGDSGTTKELGRSDVYEADYGIPSWNETEDQPKIYDDQNTPTLKIQIMPIPDEDGTLRVHYVPTAALLTGDDEIMTIPDEFVSAIKYGILSDMLTKVGRAQDPRAKYCEDRFRLGIDVAQLLLGGFR